MIGYQTRGPVAVSIDDSTTVDLYSQVRTNIRSQLETTDGATFTYTPAEKDFWMAKASSVATPVEYGYAGVDMVSYSLGHVVMEYPVMLAIPYGVLFVGGSLLAARSFSRHQVA